MSAPLPSEPAAELAVANPHPKPVPRYRPGERTLAEIISDLSREIPARFLGAKQKGNQKITIYSWMVVQRFLDHYAPGWSGRATPVLSTERVACSYELCIPTADAGVVCRAATGDDQEDDDEGWGSPMTRAEGQAFKRAAARFGFGLYLRDRR